MRRRLRFKGKQELEYNGKTFEDVTFTGLVKETVAPECCVLVMLLYYHVMERLL